MAQKIKVQDGNIVFSTSDPALNINFGIKGSLDVTKNITVGDDPSTPGVITTSVDPATNIGQNLNITTGSGISGNGNLNLMPTGVLSLNSVLWPTLSSTITSGSFIGASSLNTLAFYPFIFAYTGSDTLTTTQLNILYPSIQPGQYVIGPTVVYACIATGTWRITGLYTSY